MSLRSLETNNKKKKFRNRAAIGKPSSVGLLTFVNKPESQMPESLKGGGEGIQPLRS